MDCPFVCSRQLHNIRDLTLKICTLPLDVLQQLFQIVDFGLELNGGQLFGQVSLMCARLAT